MTMYISNTYTRLTVGDLDVQVAYLSYIFYSYVEACVLGLFPEP